MAGWSGNVATWGFAKQTVKGTPASAPIIKTKFTGGNITPVRVVNRLSETAATRDAGASYTSSVMARGTTSAYARPDDVASLAYYALGANVDAGASPFTHTATASDTDVPYVTIFKMLAATSGSAAILEKFTDCKLVSLKINGGAGQALTYDAEWLGISPLFLATNDVVAVSTQGAFTYDQVTISKGGAAITTCDSFEVTITNGITPMMGNAGITPYDLFPGERTVSGSATILYENTDNYRNFHYGGVAGTSPTRALFAEALVFTLTQTANLKVVITINSATYQDVPVAPDASGAPIMSALAFEAEPNPGGSIATIVTSNATALAG